MILVLSSISAYAQEIENIRPDHLLHISIKGIDKIVSYDSWVTINRENFIFPINRFAEEFNKSTCKNKYYYEVKTAEGGIYWNHFCPKGTLTWDGELTIKEDLEFKQNLTTLVLPFFEEAEKVAFMDKDANTILEVSLNMFSKTKEKIEDATEPIDSMIDFIPEEEPVQIIEEPTVEITETPIIRDDKMYYIILTVVLVLIIVIAILIMKIKNQQPPKYNQYQNQ